MTDITPFHPQFQSLLDIFERRAPLYLLQFSDPLARATVSSRPVAVAREMAVNAWVEPADDGFAAYTLTAGAIAALVDISVTLSATETFIAEVPLIGRAIETRNSYDRSHFANYGELSGGEKEALPLIPIRWLHDDPRRAAIGEAVLDLACRFLMLHEQMHFIRGHLHYLGGSAAPAPFDEIPRNGALDLPAAERRALELDADGSAFANLLMQYERRDVMLRSFTSNVANEWEWARIVTLASLIVMLLLSIAAEVNEASGDAYHPSPQVRMLNLLDTLVSYVRTLPSFVATSPHPAIFALFKDIAIVAETMTVAPPSPEAWTEWRSADPADFRHPICRELRDLRSTLQSLVPRLR